MDANTEDHVTITQEQMASYKRNREASKRAGL